jgi:hypothetical protein
MTLARRVPCGSEAKSKRALVLRTAEGNSWSDQQRFALEHHHTSLESDTTTQHNAREAKSIERMQRCAHAGTCERRGGSEDTGEAGE